MAIASAAAPPLRPLLLPPPARARCAGRNGGEPPLVDTFAFAVSGPVRPEDYVGRGLDAIFVEPASSRVPPESAGLHARGPFFDPDAGWRIGGDGIGLPDSAVATLQADGIDVVARLSVGLTDPHRDYWRADWADGDRLAPDRDALPPFLTPSAEAYDTTADGLPRFRVDPFDEAWGAILRAEIDRLIEAGYDGVLLDDVLHDTGFVATALEAQEAHDKAMLAVLTDLAAAAREADPQFRIWVADTTFGSVNLFDPPGTDDPALVDFREAIDGMVATGDPVATPERIAAQFADHMPVLDTADAVSGPPDADAGPVPPARLYAAIREAETAGWPRVDPSEGGPDLGEGPAAVTAGATEDGVVLIGTFSADALGAFDGRDSVAALGGDDRLGLGAGADEASAGEGDDTVWLGAGDDTGAGGAGADRLIGHAGDDSLDGGDGDDRLVGGEGADALSGDGGADTLHGFSGKDVLHGRDGPDLLLAGANADTLRGGSGADSAFGQTGDDSVEGRGGDDLVHGGAGGDVLSGGSGEDTVVGSLGDDTIDGGAGFDRIAGGAGDDRISAGPGGGIVFGGEGEDVFVIEGGTLVGDFAPGQDRLALADPDLALVSARVVGGAVAILPQEGAAEILLLRTGIDDLTADDFVVSVAAADGGDVA